jgi:hypothetical protein
MVRVGWLCARAPAAVRSFVNGSKGVGYTGHQCDTPPAGLAHAGRRCMVSKAWPALVLTSACVLPLLPHMFGVAFSNDHILVPLTF